MEPKKNMIVRLSSEKLSKYKELCEFHSYTMSKRIRHFIDTELDFLEFQKKVAIKLNEKNA